jgi:hypothetical protein
MDELTTNLQLMETISASDAMNNARTVLEEAAEDMDTEHWEAIRRYVFPLPQAEHDRLDGAYQRLRN